MNSGRMPPSRVHAQHLQPLAAIRPAAAAGVAGRVVDVGLDRAAVARPDVRHALADRDHFDAQFVPQNPRIRDKRHLAEIGADIGAADAHAMHADQRLARTGRRGIGQLDRCELLAAIEGEGLACWRAGGVSLPIAWLDAAATPCGPLTCPQLADLRSCGS